MTKNEANAILMALRAPVHRTWSAIGSDFLDCAEELDNESCIEGCIDADRLLAYGGATKAEREAAQAALINACSKHGYGAVLKLLAKNIQLN